MPRRDRLNALPCEFRNLPEAMRAFNDAVRRWLKTTSATAVRDATRTSVDAALALEDLAEAGDAVGLSRLVAQLNTLVALFVFSLALLDGRGGRPHHVRAHRRWYGDGFDEPAGYVVFPERPGSADVASLLGVEVAEVEEAVGLGVLSFDDTGPSVHHALLPALTGRPLPKRPWLRASTPRPHDVSNLTLPPELELEIEAAMNRHRRAQAMGVSPRIANLTRHVVVTCSSDVAMEAVPAGLVGRGARCLIELQGRAIAAGEAPSAAELEMEVALRDGLIVVRQPSAEKPKPPSCDSPFGLVMGDDDEGDRRPFSALTRKDGRLGVVVWLTRSTADLPAAVLRTAKVVQANEPTLEWRRARLCRSLPSSIRLASSADVALAEIPVEELDAVGERLTWNVLDHGQNVRLISGADLRAALLSGSDQAVLPRTEWHGNSATLESLKPMRAGLVALHRGLPGAAAVQQLSGVARATVLLFGPPGTGKSLLAHWIACWLGLAFLLRKPSDILGTYVGESEGNLSDAFAEARRTNSVLLLDEVDTYASPRACAHSRPWTDSLTNELLQQLEEHTLPVVFTSNRSPQGLDEAFLRRCNWKQEIPRPDAEARHHLWKEHLKLAELEGSVNVTALAKFNLTGGHIAICVQRAAYAALAESRRVRESDLLREARAEAGVGATNHRAVGF